MKKHESSSAKHEKQKIVLSLIGWLIDLIITAVRKSKEKKSNH